MILTPASLALAVVSFALAAIAVTASATSVRLLSRWRPDAADEAQLEREHRLLLVETALGAVLWVQLVALLAFLWVADDLHPRLVGAMCAAGTLAAGRFGYAALTLKVAALLLVGLWWLVHRESRGALAPGLVRAKHLSLLGVSGLLVADAAVQLRYFAELSPDVLTSCCATLFRPGSAGLGSRLAAVEPRAGQVAFFALLGTTLAVGGRRFRSASACARAGAFGGYLYAGLAVATAGAAIVGVITWVAPAYYEAPTHHCPFCLLARDEGYVGYPLYAALAVGLLAGLAAGAVRALRPLDACGALRPRAEIRLGRQSLVGFLAFALIATWPLLSSGLRLEAL